MTDGPLVEQARKEAQGLIADDPGLDKEENLNLRNTYQSKYEKRFNLIEVG